MTTTSQVHPDRLLFTTMTKPQAITLAKLNDSNENELIEDFGDCPAYTSHALLVWLGIANDLKG